MRRPGIRWATLSPNQFHNGQHTHQCPADFAEGAEELVLRGEYGKNDTRNTVTPKATTPKSTGSLRLAITSNYHNPVCLASNYHNETYLSNSIFRTVASRYRPGRHAGRHRATFQDWAITSLRFRVRRRATPSPQTPGLLVLEAA
jgi:hypothetical protein